MTEGIMYERWWILHQLRCNPFMRSHRQQPLVRSLQLVEVWPYSEEICLPCASRSLITLAVITYTLSCMWWCCCSSHKDAPIWSSQLCRGRTVHLELSSSTATQLPSYIVVPSWFENRTVYQSISPVRLWLFLAVRVGEHNFPTHHCHHYHQRKIQRHSYSLPRLGLCSWVHFSDGWSWRYATIWSRYRVVSAPW